MTAMTIQAVVFDIGGGLEITPDLGVTRAWESRLGLAPGELDERMPDPGIYALTCTRLGVEPAQMAFLDDCEDTLVGRRPARGDAYHYALMRILIAPRDPSSSSWAGSTPLGAAVDPR